MSKCVLKCVFHEALVSLSRLVFTDQTKSKLGLCPLRAFNHGQAVRLPYALSNDEHRPILCCSDSREPRRRSSEYQGWRREYRQDGHDYAP